MAAKGTKPKVGTNTGNAGKGRPKGSPNKATKELKDMILQALDQAGGVAYLKRQAIEKPAAFIGLIGKVLPLQIANAQGESFVVTVNKLTDGKSH